MKQFIINSLIGFLGIIIGAVVITALSAFFTETFMEVVNTFVGSLILLVALCEATILVALLIKGAKALCSIKVKSSKPVARRYSFNIWMKWYSRRREKFFKTITIEAFSFEEAKAMMEESYPSIMYTVEAC